MNMKSGYTKSMAYMTKGNGKMTAGSMTKQPGKKTTMTKTMMKTGKKY